MATLAIAGIVIFAARSSICDKRSMLGHIARYWKGETVLQQRAGNLADDLRQKPSLAQLQRWAQATMTRFRAGALRGETGSHFYWTLDAFALAPVETPAFIKDIWGRTNRDGLVSPLISIVLTNGQPHYVVIAWDWGSWGVLVGAPEFRVPFVPHGLNEVSPGLYTYFVEK